jgi:hypothetical protein
MATTSVTAAEVQIGRGRRHSLWVRGGVPLIRALLLAGAAIACWHIVPASKPAKQSAPATVAEMPEAPRMRAEYPLSLIPGGVRSDDDLEAARASDPLLAAHYADVGFLRPAFLAQDRLFYASYRQGSSIVWTRSPIPVRAGEPILADRSGNLIRGRCGNRLSETAHLPVGFVEPSPPMLETPEVSFAPDITLPDISADHLAMPSLPAFPSIEAPATTPKIPNIATTLPVPPELPLEPPFDNLSIFGSGIPAAVAKPHLPNKIPAPEPDTAALLTAGVLLTLYVFRAKKRFGTGR